MKIGKKEFNFKDNVYIMGILNVTPDSFSDGGKYTDIDSALFHAEKMIKDGAAIIDIGGESTRPGYERISEEEEIERVAKTIEAVSKNFDTPVSTDTYKSKVAREAIKAGASMINDIWGLKADKDMAFVAAKYNTPCCIMHNRDVEKNPYTDFLDDVVSDLSESIKIAQDAGLKKELLIVDPGIGFAKTYEENLKIMKEIKILSKLSLPILLGTSRKSMIGLALKLPKEERVEGTIATTVYGVMNNVSIIRVHDVKENYRAMKMAKIIRDAG